MPRALSLLGLTALGIAAAPVRLASAEAWPGSTRDAVQAALGTPPDACASSGLAETVCSWHVARGEPGFDRLAGEARSAPGIQLVCTFARGAAAAARCTTHRPPASIERRDYSRGGASHTAHRKRAEADLAQAATLGDVAHLVGEAPAVCVEREQREWVCEFRIDGDEAGHAVVGPLAGEWGDVSLVCRFPLDGSAREADSCRARAMR